MVMNYNKRDYSELWMIHRAVRCLRENTERLTQPFCEQHGVTYAQLCVLMALAAGGAQGVGQLSQSTCMAVGNCSALCKKLAEKGLVRRRRSPQDERRVHIALAPKGAALVRSFLQAQRGACARWAALPLQDASAIRAGLETLEIFTARTAETDRDAPHPMPKENTP